MNKTAGRVRLTAAACATLALIGFVQESRADSPRYPAEGQQGPLYYKGLSPGVGNVRLFRFDEDYGYLKDPAKSNNFFDPVKYVPLGADPEYYVSFNLQERFFYDKQSHVGLGVGTGIRQTNSATLGPAGTPTYAGNNPAPALEARETYRARTAVGADLHLGPNFRAYVDFWRGDYDGTNLALSASAFQRNRGAIVNGFLEFDGTLAGAKTGARLGRQTMWLGNGQNMAPAGLPNITQSFDGARLWADWGAKRVDAFAFNGINWDANNAGAGDQAKQRLWGVYASFDLAPFKVGDDTAHIGLDPYYLGWLNNCTIPTGCNGERYNARTLVTSISPTGVPTFFAGRDRRSDFALRYYGDIGRFDFDNSVVLQTGSFAGRNVRAFLVQNDLGYSFPSVAGKPRVALRADVASGGGDGSTLKTFQPLYQFAPYYAANTVLTPMNLIDVSPRVSFNPVPAVTVAFYVGSYWRYSTADAVYTGARGAGAGPNLFTATALTSGRKVGTQPDLQLTWRINRNLLAFAEVAHFMPGAALKAAGARDTTWVMTYLQFRI